MKVGVKEKRLKLNMAEHINKLIDRVSSDDTYICHQIMKKKKITLKCMVDIMILHDSPLEVIRYRNIQSVLYWNDNFKNI